MTRTGLRELRQQASELVRQAEAGETIIVTVNGREVAELGPVRRHRWRRTADIAEIFRGTPDAEWATDRAKVADSVKDPFGQ
ncbi:MAG TPA: type II toxin-antitoxin system prevent-host-death family antitoxin [Jatrophihabitans sp.]|nr:type II toxin-antitoxin system prevent-host-death family antitoxin [Jatrophihabitans sp.]